MNGMTPDLWGEVIPAYGGAIGTIAASIVATVALIRDIRTRGGLNVVTANSNQRTAADAPSRNAAIIAGAGDVELLNFARTSLFRNLGADPITVLDVSTRTDGVEYTAEQPLPAQLQEREWVSIRIRRSPLGPSTGEFAARWRDADGKDYTSTFLA